MEIGVIGINHKLADLNLREALAKACQRQFALFNLKHRPHRFILLSTCNRTEVYFHSPNLSEAQAFVLQTLREEVHVDFDQKLYSFFQKDCFHHLCRVTAGLDSAIAGETEIQGQVKVAYENHASQGELHTSLHFAFQKALKVGKSLRTELPLTTLPSLEQAILATGLNFFKEKDPSVLIVGASHINSKVVPYLKQRGFQNITLCNRSEQAAACWEDLPRLKWSERDQWKHYDWLIFGTKAQAPLLHKKDLGSKEQLIIDLGVPRNVDPEVGSQATLYNIDQLNKSLRHKKQKLHILLEGAEKKVGSHCQRLAERYYAKQQWQKAI